MLAVRGRLNAKRQAIVDIGIQPFIPSAVELNGFDIPMALQIKTYPALIDTGAGRTLLSQKIITEEKLISHGKRELTGVTGDGIHRLYLTNLGIWANGEHDDPSIAIRSYFAWDRPVEVMNFQGNESFDALIGMDVLEHFSFSFERGGRFQLMFG